MASTSIPTYRVQTDGRRRRAFVQLGEKRVYLGRANTRESLQEYHRVVAEWLANGDTPVAASDDLTVSELLTRFWRYAESYYKKPDGTNSTELRDYRMALKPVRDLYGRRGAAEFGPRALKAVRQRMIDSRNSRRYINHQMGRIKRVFKWAVAEELIEPAVYQRLQAVEGLRRGRSEARESKAVKPVPQVHIDAIKVSVPA